MKNALVVLAVVLFGAFGVGYIIDAVLTKEAVRDIENRANNPTSQPIMSESEARNGFIAGCVGESQGVEGNNVYCECMYREIRKTTTINQLANLGLNASEAELQAWYSREINQCSLEAWGVELL